MSDYLLVFIKHAASEYARPPPTHRNPLQGVAMH